MFSTILVPLDGTAESNAALPLARTVAQASGGSITLMRVVAADSSTTAAQVSDTLQRIATELSESTPHVDIVVREAGDVARQILAEISARQADLVIMRTHGRAGVGRLVLGSVTEQVLAASEVPVMLLRPGGRRITHIRKLLVPVDGSPGSIFAVDTAVQLCHASGASMSVVEVSVPSPLYTGDAYSGMAYYDPNIDQDALAAAHTRVDDVVARVRASNVDVDGEVRQEPRVADAIVAAAELAVADLIVMSTRALTGPARAFLGSTADAVVRTAHCPVLLIHRPDTTDEAVDESTSTPYVDSVPAG